VRGNARQHIFFDDQDRYRFCFLLQEALERYRRRAHAFCLMTNHVHMALQRGEVPLSGLMQNPGFRYTAWINRRFARTGHLFQGRFKAVLVVADSYLLELVRYIHLNPVRAGMVTKPEQYPWSSHNAYCAAMPLPWLTTEWVWSRFSTKKEQAINAYGKFVAAGMTEQHRAEFHSGTGEDSRLLGDDGFIARVLGHSRAKQGRSPTLDDVIEQVCRKYGIERNALKLPGKERLLSEARALAAWLVLETGCSTLAELGKLADRDVSTLSSAAKRFQLRVKNDSNMASIKDDIVRSIP